ncbi:protein FAF-like, chloroplastic [Neltuma alba]|uniref:protein FAF-like, chloroplastic n=1 Tax=Neltuma alba TaxID=207710 RepID=UPI0010A3A614|nr:protein FAF-like, chloroplastic [Prosopis alba]
MSASMSHDIHAQVLSSMEEETKLAQNQGILTILGSESVRNEAPSSSLRLRRTLSADMSSKKWLSRNGFTPMKRIASSENLTLSKIIPDSFSSSEGDDNCEQENKRPGSEDEQPGQSDIWASIQRDKNKDHEQREQFDIWSSILSQKANEDSSKSLPPPYVHPLVKRSQSSLSEKSLEICTESLGSETGFDLPSSDPPSETGDSEEDREEEREQKVTGEAEEDNFEVPRYNYTANSKKSSPRSFPPPLPSLSRSDGPSLHMRSHRDDGRLVLEAMSVPSQNNFSAQRQDGRLVLTFANQEPNEEDAVEMIEEEAEEDEMEEELAGIEEDDETEKEKVGEIETMGDQTTMLSRGVTRLTWMMNKPAELANSNPNWSEKLNDVVKVEDVPRMARFISSGSAIGSSTSFNVYEYSWRTNPTPNSNPLSFQQDYNTSSIVKNSNNGKFIVSGDMNQISNEKQQLVVLRGKNGDYLVHNLKGCKESRRSFLLWEPYCIAT